MGHLKRAPKAIRIPMRRYGGGLLVRREREKAVQTSVQKRINPPSVVAAKEERMPIGQKLMTTPDQKAALLL